MHPLVQLACLNWNPPQKKSVSFWAICQIRFLHVFVLLGVEENVSSHRSKWNIVFLTAMTAREQRKCKTCTGKADFVSSTQTPQTAGTTGSH